MKSFACIAALTLLVSVNLMAESFRSVVAGSLIVSVKEPEGSSIDLSYVDSVVLGVSGDVRFIKGLELEIQAPPSLLRQRGSMAFSLYRKLTPEPVSGIGDYTAERIAFSLLPGKLQSVYQIPTRKEHGLRSSPYVSIVTTPIGLSDFPLLFRLQPVMKGLSEDLETGKFRLIARPVLSDEGALNLTLRYPEQLKDRPLTVLVDDEVIVDHQKPLILKEGEHAISIVSEDYRNESRTFVVERAKETDLTIELRDTTPLVRIEAPEGVTVLFDEEEVLVPDEAFPTTPGEHKVTFKVSDYTVSKPILVIKGRSYRVGLSIDVSVTEAP